MRRILLAILLMFSLASIVHSQQLTGDGANQVQKEIMNLEWQKTLALEKGVDGIVEWFGRVNSEGLVHVDDGGLRTRAQCIAEFKSGKRIVNPCKATALAAHAGSLPSQADLPISSTGCSDYFDYKVRVYGNGNTAVLTYYNRINDKLRFVTDFYMKEGGMWQREVHQSTLLSSKRTESEMGR